MIAPAMGVVLDHGEAQTKKDASNFGSDFPQAKLRGPALLRKIHDEFGRRREWSASFVPRA